MCVVLLLPLDSGTVVDVVEGLFCSPITLETGTGFQTGEHSNTRVACRLIVARPVDFL